MPISTRTSTTLLDPAAQPDNSGNAQQDVLPGYENTPDYSAETYHQPLVTYHLRATKTNTSHLVPFEPTASKSHPSYEIRYRSSTALPIFNRKGDISVSRTWLSSEASSTTVIARADFHDKGPLPYCPRARFTLDSPVEGNPATTIEMSSPNWKNWKFSYEAASYVWTLRDIPACIELSSADSYSDTAPPVIARFTYGKVGTKVLAGGEVGQLEVWRDALTESTVGREVVVLGCLVVVKYFVGLGRRYRNDGSGGSGAGALINPKGDERARKRGMGMF